MKFYRINFNGLQLLIIITICFGLFFRLTNLDRKFYWYDENFTSLRISGFTTIEFIEQVSDGQLVDREDIQKYQQPNFDKNVIHLIESLAKEEPQHPPLYFVLARFWVQWFGNSVSAIRSLSAFISLLILPSVYWLCRELFESSFVGAIAVALISVSPFHILYAQEAREYSLWMLITVLSSAALLRAIRLKTNLSWGLYALTILIGLYTFPFFLLSTIGYGIYTFTQERFKLSQTSIAYLGTSLLGILAFSPWLLIFTKKLPDTNSDINTSWMLDKLSFPDLAMKWLGIISRIFIDWGVSYREPLIAALLLIPPILILVGYSLYFLYFRTSQRIWLFIFTLIGIPASALILNDLIRGGRLSVMIRYFTPSILGIQLSISYLLARQLTALSQNIWRQKLWQLTCIFLISCGIFSAVKSSQSHLWWHQGAVLGERNYQISHAIARLVNQSERPLLISDITNNDMTLGYILSVSYLVEPKVKFQFVTSENVPKIPDGFSDVFLFSLSHEFKNGVERSPNYQIEPIDIDTENVDAVFWKARK